MSARILKRYSEDRDEKLSKTEREKAYAAMKRYRARMSKRAAFEYMLKNNPYHLMHQMREGKASESIKCLVKSFQSK